MDHPPLFRAIFPKLSLVVFVLSGAVTPLDAQDNVELTAAYKQCLAQFAPNLKEQLRIAQRAWIVFSNKDEAAAALAGKRRGLSEDDLDRESLKEVNARAEQLRSFFVLPNQDVQWCKQQWQGADNELTVAYRNAMSFLLPEEIQRLREAERAWIDYRDKNARAHIGDPSGRAPVWAAVVVTRRRTEELNEFYVGKIAQAPTVAPTPEPTSTAPPLDPAVQSKMIADFKDETNSVLAKVSAQPDIFKELTSLNGAKDLPGSLSESIATLAEKARDFRGKIGYEVALRDCKAESATVDALTTLAKVEHEIAAGDAAAASNDLNEFHRDHPDPVVDKQKPLWGSLESMRKLCSRLGEEAKTHLEHAQSLSAEGKTGEAIGEYQKTYRIFPDPGIAQTIKRLREESLGL